MHTPEPLTGTVLLIDSEERLPAQRAAFEAQGLDVVTATSTADGLAMARVQRPDLIVSEVMLEKPDAGFVLGHQLKSDPELAGVPLILLSSVFTKLGVVFDLTSPEARRWIKADLYLDRPVTPERLGAKARALLHQAKSA